MYCKSGLEKLMQTSFFWPNIFNQPEYSAKPIDIQILWVIPVFYFLSEIIYNLSKVYVKKGSCFSQIFLPCLNFRHTERFN